MPSSLLGIPNNACTLHCQILITCSVWLSQQMIMESSEKATSHIIIPIGSNPQSDKYYTSTALRSIYPWKSTNMRSYKYTFLLRNASLAILTAYLTLDEIHKYLKNLWCADQNCPHIDFLIDFSASIKSAASQNLLRASTHCNEQSQAFKSWHTANRTNNFSTQPYGYQWMV